MTLAARTELRALVRTMYDYQDMRIRTAGRLRLKADDTPQDETNMQPAEKSESNYGVVESVKLDTQSIEGRLKKEIEKEVKAQPIWDAFFDGVKGCGPLMAAVCLSEFDIEKATTVSKMWQFAGLNPGMVRGKKRKELKNGEFEIYATDEMVRGDRRTPGYVAPYNAWLRTKLVGVLADCMVKAQSSYALDYYYPYKARLEQEETTVVNGKPWKDESKGHRNNAAKRYMIKMFLRDLYVAWRTIEGLPVRQPYQEEYLGHTHVKSPYLNNNVVG